ncbi:kallikrein-15 [Sorex fumeus]|uniref:kallikrein-15 n=1 Tax=Sorex fumeus TaxID=62283 RepID=UPI0024ADEAF1|nr:kallikrein-15 [Sorex fumeus]
MSQRDRDGPQLALQGDGDKVMRGAECEPHSQPWQVALFERGRFNCGASLIAPSWVLSAAHCQTRFMRVRLGKHNLRKREGSEQLRTVVRVIPHPGYEPLSHRHDLMLLRLAQPARLSRQVSPVTLPTHCPRPGEPCVVSGWGLVHPCPLFPPVSLTDTLHCAIISIIREPTRNDL